MPKKLFHLGDVLTITTGFLVSPSHVGGYYDILNFMSSDNLFTHQLPRVRNECSPYLRKQFPFLDSSTISSAVTELETLLEGKESAEECRDVVDEWLLKLLGNPEVISNLPLCGPANDMLEVETLPPEEHERIDPESELAEKIHPSKIIKIRG